MTPVNRRLAAAAEVAKARRALTEAVALLDLGLLEGCASRAYYEAFHAARAALLTVGAQPRTHQGVNQQFNLLLVVPGALEPRWLSVLGRLQTRREQADYSVDSPDRTETATLVDAATAMVQRVEALLETATWE